MKNEAGAPDDLLASGSRGDTLEPLDASSRTIASLFEAKAGTAGPDQVYPPPA